MKILVAGAGIAGSCAAHVLRDAGHDVVLADPAPDTAASRCAFALTRIAWWSGAPKIRVVRSLNWYQARGHIVTSSATVHDVRRQRTTIQGDHYLISPTGPLVPRDLAASVGWWDERADGVLVDFRHWIREQYDALVVAAGPASAGLLSWPADGCSYGGIHTAPGNLLTDGGQLALLRRTDRLSYTAAFVAGETRIGASRCSSPEQAHRVADGIRDRLLSEGLVKGADWAYRSGTRYATASPGAVRISRRVWSLTGLARSGYALAPAAALDIEKEIREL
jgi:hypothetical protein